MSFILIKGLLLAIPSSEFKRWLKAFYFNNHQLLNALKFEPLEKDGFICRYITPKEPAIKFILYVVSIDERFIKASIEVADQEKDTVATQDYVLELLASAIEEEIYIYKPLARQSLERRILELRILELGEQEEENIIRFLLEYNDAQRKNASKEELLKIRCMYLAAEGRGNIIKRLWERHRTRELELTEQELLELNKGRWSLEEQIAETGGEPSPRLIYQLEKTKDAIKMKEITRQELKNSMKQNT